MPFKLRLIQQFQKSIKSVKNKDEEPTVVEEQKENHGPNKNKSRHNKRILDKNYNVFQLLYKREPTQDHHVVSFYNIIGLNETAVASPEFEESKFTTIFYIKNAKKAEVKVNHLAVQLCNSPLVFPPIQYIIQRYKSFGDMKFYNLAILLEEASVRLKTIEQFQLNEVIEDNSDFFQKYIESLGNKMFICRSTHNKLVISKPLLALLEYNTEELARQIVKYKAPLFEIFSAERYFDIITKMIENLRNLFDLINDRISLETFLNSSLIRFKDYLITKNHKRIYCKLKVGMPNPMVNLMEVEEILYHSDNPKLAVHESFNRLSIQQMKKRKQIEEVTTLRKIYPLPKNLLPECQDRVASFYLTPQQTKAETSQTHE